MKKHIHLKKSKDLFHAFFENEKASGLILIACTLISLLVSNSIFGESYINFWQSNFANKPLEYWINDGLMTIFFLLIGLELRREFVIGELSSRKSALLPIFAALGGMLVPALIYFCFNFKAETQAGVGIPMATDIAFAVGILSLLGKKVPISLKIFLTALAVIDDLGAILIIALFYTKTLLWENLCLTFGIVTLLLILNRLKIKNPLPYLIGGILMWYFMLNSGIHPTISGVIVAFLIPFENENNKSNIAILENFLHKPVAFLILPLFAFANTAVQIPSDFSFLIQENYSLGIAIGLILGKPIGVFIFSYLVVKIKICKLPTDLKWKTILAVGFLGGIGFTMSIFVTLLAFENPLIINNAKFSILLSSCIAGVLGYFSLNQILNNQK